MNTKRVTTAADVVLAALTQNRTAAGIALALESAGMLAMQSAPDDAMAKARNQAWQELRRDTGQNRTMWRTVITDSESPTGIAPVCTGERSDALHMIDDYPGGPQRDEDGVYDCCPHPQIETYSTVWAEYLAGLLNADASDELTGAYLARWEEEQDNARLRLAWRSARERAQAYGEGILRVVADRESYQGWLKQEQTVTQGLRAQVAESVASPLGWARLLDAKSLDNFLIALGMAVDTDPMDGALAQAEEMIRSFRSALPAGVEEEREQTLHDHIVARDAEIERLRFRLAELGDQGPDEHETVEEAAQMYRGLRPVIERTMAEPDRWDGDEDESFHLGRYVEWLAGRVAELEAERATAFRASHDSIVFGLYNNRDAARDHCEAFAEREFPKPFAAYWHEHDDGVSELMVAKNRSQDTATGYVVTPLTVASEFGPDADE